MITWMGRAYLSELRPPSGLFFIPLVVYSHGEPWWVDIDQRSLLILRGESSSSKTGGIGKGRYELYLIKYVFNTSKCYLTCYKILRNVADGFTSPPKEGVLRISIALQNPFPPAAFEPENLGSSGEYANH
jgi:hypothetical protein